MPKDPKLARAGVSAYNKPKRTPSHKTKSHVVVAKEGDKTKTIRFGQQGVKGSPDGSARNKAFKARHAKNIAKGKMSAAFWADKVKWTIFLIGANALLSYSEGMAHAQWKFESYNHLPALLPAKRGAR